MIKKIFGLILVVTMIFTTKMAVSSEDIATKEVCDTDNKVENTNIVLMDFDCDEVVEVIIYNYFKDIFQILETGDISNYDKEDIDTNTYIIIKDLEYKHNIYKKFYMGISDAHISQFDIKGITDNQDGIDVEVYVTVKYKYNGTETTSFGSMYQVNIDKNSIISVDNVSEDIQMIKDALNIRKESMKTSDESIRESEHEMIDKLFKEKNDMLLEGK